MDAPGGPGAPPMWGPGRKMAFGTAPGSRSKVWYTLAGGSLSEVFFPFLDHVALHELRFFVSAGGGPPGADAPGGRGNPTPHTPPAPAPRVGPTHHPDRPPPQRSSPTAASAQRTPRGRPRRHVPACDRFRALAGRRGRGRSQRAAEGRGSRASGVRTSVARPARDPAGARQGQRRRGDARAGVVRAAPLPGRQVTRRRLHSGTRGALGRVQP